MTYTAQLRGGPHHGQDTQVDIMGRNLITPITEPLPGTYLLNLTDSNPENHLLTYDWITSNQHVRELGEAQHAQDVAEPGNW